MKNMQKVNLNFQSDKIKKYLFVLGVSVLIIGLFFKYGYFAYVLFVAGILMFLIVKKPENVIWLLYFSVFFLPGIRSFFNLNISLDYVYWGLSIILCILVFANFSRRRIKINKIDLLLILYFIFLTVSAVLGRNSVFVSFKTILAYIQFPLLFIFLNHMPLAKKFPQKLLKYIFVAIYLQIPIVLIQRFILKGKYLSSDLFTGTLGKGSTGLLAVLMSFGFSIIFARILFNRDVKKNTLILLLLTIPVIIGSGKFGHIVVVLLAISLIVIHMIASKKTSIRRLFKYAIIGGIGLITIFVSLKFIMPLISTRESRTIAVLTNLSEMRRYAFVERNGYIAGKLGRITYSYEFIKNNPKTLFFGYGPGTLSKSRFFDEQSEVSRIVMAKIGPSVGISDILINTGWLGLAIYLYLLYSIFRYFYKIYFFSDNKNLKCFILGFIGVIISFTLSMLYVRPHIDPIVAFTFWTLAGLLYRAIRTNKYFKIS